MTAGAMPGFEFWRRVLAARVHGPKCRYDASRSKINGRT